MIYSFGGGTEKDKAAKRKEWIPPKPKLVPETVILRPPKNLKPAGDLISTAEDEVLLTWDEVRGAQAYEVRVLSDDPKKSKRKPARKRDREKEGKRYLVTDSELAIPTPKVGKYRWEVRSTAATRKRKIQETLSRPARSTFQIKKADVFTEAASGSGYFAFSGLIAPYQYNIFNPTVGAASMDSVSTTVRISGEYILSSNWGLDFGADTTFFRSGFQSIRS